MTRGPHGATSLPPLQILLVEDNPGDIYLIEHCLRELRIPTRLSVARSAAEAETFLRGLEADEAASVPDLVLLDLHLPIMGGIELLTWIRSQPRLAPLLVVVLTCSDSQVDVARCRELGVAEYVIKAFDLTELPRVAQAIESHLETCRVPVSAT